VEEVISSGEMSKGSVLLRVQNEVSDEIVKIHSELVTDVHSTQIRPVFGDAVFIEVTVSLVSEIDNKY